MPLAQYPLPSPHLYASPRDTKYNNSPHDRGRKSSLTKSIQAFAKNTFHRRQRYTNTGGSSHGTTPATSFTSSSCPPSPGVPQSRSELTRAPVIHSVGKVPMTPRVDSKDQTKTFMGITTSPTARSSLSIKQGCLNLHQPVPVKPCNSDNENPHDRAQPNGKQGVKYSVLKEETGRPQVSRIPLPSPQPDGYPARRNRKARMSLQKSATFTSFISLRHGSSLSRHQSLSKNNKSSCGQPNPVEQQQQQIGAMARELAHGANAQIEKTANNAPAGSFGSLHCLTPKKQPLSLPKGRSLQKSQTAINIASYSKFAGYSAPTESFISRYHNNDRSKCSVTDDRDDTGSLSTLRGRYKPPNTEPKDACCSDAQQTPSLKEKIPMEEPISPCPSPVNDDEIRTVTTAKPCQYWVGRFSTLVNSFHHEDSFKEESDVATGYDGSTAPAYFYISSSSTATLNDQRAKRAFVHLENACATTEARVSFLEFRDAYSKRFGDRWSKWFLRDAATPDCKKGYADTASNLTDGTFISAKEMGDTKRKLSENGALGGGSGGASAGGIGLMNMFRTVRKSLA
ncbi:hypothetical protein AJ78_01830 [Emergomyces pasteurianus Ep9510]|uniref:Uncharacterized protein n=1 Tax=Emergomyces pasteurianus Ep9510 TaxID=1447872 RepID=A0A1J9PNQ7_9EURO|nr:hypothetical protein AJ78_01830 [Emergomyces pasteurianus Ep9510]